MILSKSQVTELRINLALLLSKNPGLSLKSPLDDIIEAFYGEYGRGIPRELCEELLEEMWIETEAEIDSETIEYPEDY